MANFTVTIDVADFVSDGVAPRLACVTFSRLVVDSTTSEIVTTAPISVRVTQTPATVSLQAGVTYKVRGDGISGVGTFYAQGAVDCSLADFRDEHQVDPITQQPVDQVVTVGEAIAAVQQQLSDFIGVDEGDDATTAAALAARPTTATVNQLIAAQAASDAASTVPLGQLAANPDELAVGAITRSGTGAATGFGVVWPDGSTGTFAGTESTGFPGAIDAYTVTKVKSGVTVTFTQPALTRDANGAVTNRPAMTVA